jgi:hypothetical protein
MSEKRYFVLQKGGKDTAHVFTGKQPRQAALKAANRGEKEITLRERGTKKVHMYKGSRKEVSAPANAPDWMPAKIYKPVVKKDGIKYLK